MPTIAHLIIGILIPLLLFYVLGKKFSIGIVLYFTAGSILPDIYSIIKIFIFPYISKSKWLFWNAPHGFFSWIYWGFGFAIIFHLLFHRISKIKLHQIFIILLSGGWFHLGLDMFPSPVRVIGNFYISVSSFYTSVMILEEQDFIIVFYVVFLILPLGMLIAEIRKIASDINKNYKQGL